MQIPLTQASRAGLEFLGATQSYAGGVLQARAAAEYREAEPNPPVPILERKASVEHHLADSAAWAFDRFLTRWVAEEAYVRALPAAETAREEIIGWVGSRTPAGTLTLNPGFEAPEYWENGFHLAPGGWDGHELMGPAIHELVFGYILRPGGVGAVRHDENLNDQRHVSARCAPRESYEQIIELGAGTGRFTTALAHTYPEARITAVELSASSLKYAHALSSEAGLAVDWYQAPAEDTRLESGQADLVAAYTLMHEVPTESNQQILHEAFRLLAPGGDLMICEVAPYEEHDAFRAVVLDWETENRGEPYWRDALTMDLPGMLRTAGFTGIRSFGATERKYPWITLASKPQA